MSRFKPDHSSVHLSWSLLLLAGACLTAPAATLHDFGSVNVNGTAGTYAFSASIPSVTAAPVLSLTGTAFSLASASCTVTSGSATCTATVTFAPPYPGLSTGAIYAKTSSGILLATYDLKGTGLAAQLVFTPGIITNLAGTGIWGYNNAPPASATFRNPSGLAMDQTGNIYVADSINQVVRKITATSVTTFAGNGGSGYTGDNGAATSATLNNPTGVALDEANNLYIADQGNNLIRRVDAVSGIITTVAGGGLTLITSTSSNVQARSAALLGPSAVAVDLSGNLFISDSFHQKILRVNASTGVISVYAGGGTGGSGDGLGDGASALSAILSEPGGLALDASNNLYIADSGDNMIRVVNAATGIISVAAGSGGYGYAGDGGSATSAWLRAPSSVRVDAAGNLYIADFGNNVIRQVLAATGAISTLAGTGTNGHTGDGGLASSATLANPMDIVLGPSGNLYIDDYANNVIRQVTPLSPSLSFSNVVAGLASLPQTVTLVNRGNETLMLSAVILSNSFRQVTSIASCSSGLTLPAGGSCTIKIEFAPVANGTISGTLSLSSNSLNITGTQTLALSGTGIGGNSPNVSVSVSTIGFGPVAAGITASRAVTLSNTGTGALSLQGISLSGNGAFTESTTCVSSLAPGASCTVTIAFAPLVSTGYSGTLTFTDSAGTSPQSVAISGSGTGGPIGTLGTTSLYFSPVVTGASLTQVIPFTNTGTTSLAISGASLSGPNSSDFNIGSNCGATLAVSKSCTFTIAFNPGATGLRSSVLTIVDNGAGSPHSISLSGSSLNTPLQFVPITPCRVLDTRSANGSLGGPEMAAASTRSFLLPNGLCGIPANAAAFVLNVAVVPKAQLGYLSIWPNGLPQPVVATLTSDGRIKANLAIVAAGLLGGVSIYVTQATHVILDIGGYFIAGNSSALTFHAITPCRLVDTRQPAGPLAGPYLSGGTTRSFPVLSSSCNIPATAQAYSLNFTAVPHGSLGYISTWPAGQTQPLVATLLAPTGVVTANAVVVKGGTTGQISVYTTNDTDLVIDANGYFAPQSTGGTSLYVLTPCRVLDTRQTVGLFTGDLTVNISTPSCGAPTSAQAFVLNATVVPAAGLGYLSMWASNAAQPVVATLNAPDGVVTSNMAVVPASNGAISAFASNATQLVLDISGFFSP